MNHPQEERSATVDCQDVEDSRYPDFDDSEVGAMGVLARIPNLDEDAIDHPNEEDAAGVRRFLSQSLSARLLGGLAAVLVLAAILPCFVGRKGSSTTSQHSTWQPEAPAPLADTAPGWVAPNVTSSTTTTTASTIVSQPSGGNTTLAAGTPSVNPADVADAVEMSFPSDVPLTWDRFSRHYDAKMAELSAVARNAASQGGPTVPAGSNPMLPTTIANASSLTSPSASNGMASSTQTPWAASRVETAAPVYPTTSTPDLPTIGSATTASSGKEPPAYSWK